MTTPESGFSSPLMKTPLFKSDLFTANPPSTLEEVAEAIAKWVSTDDISGDLISISKKLLSHPDNQGRLADCRANEVFMLRLYKEALQMMVHIYWMKQMDKA